MKQHANATHGLSRTKEFKLWCAIKDRCLNEKCKEYHRYGGRGITMFEDWKYSFGDFIKWIKDNIGLAPERNRYSSLERIDNNKGYEPGNLKWATPTEQCRNRSSSLFVVYNGESVNLKVACEKKGLPYQAVWLRINRRNWSVEKSLDTPLIPNKKTA